MAFLEVSAYGWKISVLLFLLRELPERAHEDGKIADLTHHALVVLHLLELALRTAWHERPHNLRHVAELLESDPRLVDLRWVLGQVLFVSLDGAGVGVVSGVKQPPGEMLLTVLLDDQLPNLLAPLAQIRAL